jgi:anti-sigma factor RsiW
MIETRETFTEREEIEMLLPWFVAGTLDVADQERVERYLAAHPEMNAQLELVRDEQGETIVTNEALGGAPAGALDKLREAIAAEPRRLTAAAVRRGLWTELSRLFSAPTPRAVQWAGAAAVVVMLLQGLVIGGALVKLSGRSGEGSEQIAKRSLTAPQVAEKRAPARFRTASGGVTHGTRVLVRFVPGLSIEKAAQFLQTQRAQIVAGPKPGGFFEIRISAEKLSQTEREAAIAKLEAASDTISQVLP